MDRERVWNNESVWKLQTQNTTTKIFFFFFGVCGDFDNLWCDLTAEIWRCWNVGCRGMWCNVTMDVVLSHSLLNVKGYVGNTRKCQLSWVTRFFPKGVALLLLWMCVLLTSVHYFFYFLVFRLWLNREMRMRCIPTFAK